MILTFGISVVAFSIAGVTISKTYAATLFFSSLLVIGAMFIECGVNTL